MGRVLVIADETDHLERCELALGGVVMTALDGVDDLGRRHGARTVPSKPFRATELCSEIEAAMRSEP